MFESLDEQIKHDLHEQTSKTQRILLWGGVPVLTLIVLYGLYVVVRMVE
jgi:hypothetical protein